MVFFSITKNYSFTKIIRLEKSKITVKMIYSTQNITQSYLEKSNEYWH